MQGLRLDVAITEYCRRFSIEMSRSSLKSGNTPLHVNGKAEKLGYRVRTGDLVDFMMVKPKELRAFPQKVDFEIVYRDEDIAVINKPYGLTVHPAKGHEEGTLVHGLLYYLGSSLPDMSGPDRPGIVHRLDKDTAGLMIVALNEKAHRRLTDDFRNRKISKTYHAVVKGTLKGSGIIDEPIGRSCSDRKKMAVRTGGRPAVTRYRVLENLESHSYVEIEILTGRTHQIRVHFSYIGHPVEGDRLYSKSYGRFGLTGLALCSKKISFIHPVKGAMMDFEIDLPEEMKNLLLKLRMK
jgi:23S rRNA pseudouridine1911/1915/1917 synthase